MRLAGEVHPRWRNGSILAATALLAVWLGSAVALGNPGLALASALGVGALLLVWTRWMSLGTALLAFVVVGYVVGNRGFAQIMPYPRLPLLFGEGVLAATGCLLLVTSAFRHRLPFRLDPLNFTLLALLVLGCSRMLLVDFREHGLWAIRDFAVIYYIGYFFVAQHIAQSGRARIHISGAFKSAVLALPIVYIATEAFPEFFLTQLVVRGTPVIFMKTDLVATFLLAGVFPVITGQCAGRASAGRMVASATLLMMGLVLLSRAALLGLIVGALFTWAGRQMRLIRLAAWALPAGLVGLLGTALVQNQPWRDSRLYGLYEHVISIADFQGRGSYEGAVSLDTGDNNRFRIAWWEAIIKRTVSENAVFGLGFGYDLSRDFVSSYAAVADDFSVRSPHSIIFTILGRLGPIGLCLFGLFLAALVTRTLTAAKAARLGLTGAAEALGYWCAAWVILVSACFGVVLENPMGAVVFWILVGLAHASTTALTADGAAAAEKTSADTDPALQPGREPVMSEPGHG